MEQEERWSTDKYDGSFDDNADRTSRRFVDNGQRGSNRGGRTGLSVTGARRRRHGLTRAQLLGGIPGGVVMSVEMGECGEIADVSKHQ